MLDLLNKNKGKNKSKIKEELWRKTHLDYELQV